MPLGIPLGIPLGTLLGKLVGTDEVEEPESVGIFVAGV